MQILAFVISILSIHCLCPKTEVNNDYKNFKFSYVSVGLGSNMYSMQPSFRVEKIKYVYTFEEAWELKGRKKAKPDTISFGEFRISSIDSILNLIKDIKDSVTYKFNPHIMSGGIDYISISYDNTKISFKLDNISDPIAENIVQILNSYISNPKQKIWLFEAPKSKN